MILVGREARKLSRDPAAGVDVLVAAHTVAGPVALGQEVAVRARVRVVALEAARFAAGNSAGVQVVEVGWAMVERVPDEAVVLD